MQGFFPTLPYSRTLRQLGSIAYAATLLTACGGSSGGSGGGGGTAPAASASVSGTFVDSLVQGLGYKALPSGLSGTTDATGHYQYVSGDMVTFDIGGRVIGTVLGGPQVTALSVFGATSMTDPRVVNLSQLLLTLGGIPTGQNPIRLPATIPAGLPNPLNFSSPTFDADLQAAGFTLVSEATATTHLQTSFKTLSVTVVNSGTVTSNPVGIVGCTATAGICSYDFVTGTDVTLTATGNGFIGWSVPAGCPGTGTCVVTMNADNTVTATFPVAPPPATLTILPNQGTGSGSVACSTNGGASFGVCAGQYPNPTALVLQATQNPGSTFGGWLDGTGNAIGCNGTTGNCSMTLNADSAVRGNFVLNTVTFFLTANTSSSNSGAGTIACSMTGGAPFGACTSSYNAGTNLTLQATPNSASNFTGWGNGSGSGDGSPSACNNTTGLCNFTMTANSSTTANFNRPTLTVVVTGTGTGTVNSNPVGISGCTSNCSATFDKATPVTLTASGAGFTGWSGSGCSGTSSTCLVTLTADATVTANFSTTTGTAYPVKVGPTGRYLVDQNGVPFLMIGESPQAMIGDLTEADAELFLAKRKSQGFNTVWINLLCNSYTGCNADGSTFDGILPFTPRTDLSTPNEAYFARVDRMLQLAAQYGFLVILDPAETGGWLGVLQTNGLTQCRAYGQYLGTRYKDFPNIVWMSGNDFGSWRTNPTDDALVQAVAMGIKDFDPNHIHTIEFLTPPAVTSLDDSAWVPIVSLNAAMTYFPTYADVLRGYNQAFVPVFMVEANYEFENITNMDPSTPAILRRQEYWTALSGATGQLYGNHYTWQFIPDWQNQLDTPGAVQIGYLKALFEPRAWYNLVPDQAHSVLTAGYGTFVDSASIGANDYVTAARTPDGTLVMAYVPTTSTITVDMSQLSGPVTASWYDPAAGTFISVTGSPLANVGSMDFTTPGTNADGDADWVLVLEVP